MGFVGLCQFSLILCYFSWDSLVFPLCCPLFLVYFLTITVRKKAGKTLFSALWHGLNQKCRIVFSCFPGLSHVTPCFLTNNSQQKDFSLFVSALNIGFSPLFLRYHNDNLLTTIFWNFLSFFIFLHIVQIRIWVFGYF